MRKVLRNIFLFLSPVLFSNIILVEAQQRYVTMSNGDLEVAFDLQWGCVLYSMKWRGEELVDAKDTGREIQIDLEEDWDQPGQGPLPTQGGNIMNQGSPVLEWEKIDRRTFRCISAPRVWQRELGGVVSNWRIETMTVINSTDIRQEIRVWHEYDSPKVIRNLSWYYHMPTNVVERSPILQRWKNDTAFVLPVTPRHIQYRTESGIEIDITGDWENGGWDGWFIDLHIIKKDGRYVRAIDQHVPGDGHVWTAGIRYLRLGSEKRTLAPNEVVSGSFAVSLNPPGNQSNIVFELPNVYVSTRIETTPPHDTGISITAPQPTNIIMRFFQEGVEIGEKRVIIGLPGFNYRRLIRTDLGMNGADAVIIESSREIAVVSVPIIMINNSPTFTVFPFIKCESCN